MLIFSGLFFFILGSITASALLTWFWRAKQGKKWTVGRSLCDYCSARLPLVSLIPILGKLLIPRCPHCKNFGPWYSFVAELSVGFAWVLVWYYSLVSNNWVTLALQLIIVTALIIVTVFDFYWQEIPFYLLVILLIFTLIFILLNPDSDISLASRLVGAVASAGFFAWQYVLSRGRWIGSADIWLGAFLGFLFGWNTIVLVLAAGYGLAAVGSIIQLFMMRSKIPRTIPLGGFLSLSGLIFFLNKII